MRVATPIRKMFFQLCFGWIFAVLSAPVFGVDFPKIAGRIVNHNGVDLSSLEMDLAIQYNDINGVTKIKVVEGTVNPSTLEFSFDGTVVGPPLDEAPSKKGWGKSYSAEILIRVPKLKGHQIAHDLNYSGWERRSENTVRQMRVQMVEDLKEIAVFATREFDLPILAPVGQTLADLFNDAQDPTIYVRYQRKFFPIDSSAPPDVAKAWLEFRPDLSEQKQTLKIPPLLHFVRHAKKGYGDTPNTAVFLYALRTVRMEKEEARQPIGILEQWLPFSYEKPFKGKSTLVLDESLDF